VDLSNVMLVDPVANAPTRVGKKLVKPDEGSRGWARIARKTGDVIAESGGKAPRKGKKGKE
jgi:ribosomal protein L24